MVSTRSRKRKQIGGADEDTYSETDVDVRSAVKEDEGTGATNPVAVVSTQRLSDMQVMHLI